MKDIKIEMLGVARYVSEKDLVLWERKGYKVVKAKVEKPAKPLKSDK